MPESDEELREEQEAAAERMGIDPAELDTELRRAEAAPWHRGIFRSFGKRSNGSRKGTLE
jgi:hypothetical protein